MPRKLLAMGIESGLAGQRGGLVDGDRRGVLLFLSFVAEEPDPLEEELPSFGWGEVRFATPIGEAPDAALGLVEETLPRQLEAGPRYLVGKPGRPGFHELGLHFIRYTQVMSQLLNNFGWATRLSQGAKRIQERPEISDELRAFDLLGLLLRHELFVS